MKHFDVSKQTSEGTHKLRLKIAKVKSYYKFVIDIQYIYIAEERKKS